MRSTVLAAALACLVALPALLAAQDDTPVPASGKVSEADSAKPPAKAKAKASKPPPTPARVLFGAAKTPAPLAARAIGFYAKGCLAGATALPIDGPAWQAMRLSRNRNWGHPVLIALVEKLATEAKQHDGWPGLLVGDISQPRGGPMLTGHASHQVGLDADIWFTPMPNRRLTEKEREDLSATSMLAADRVSVNKEVWTDAHVRLLKRTASYKEVERVLIHPAIKKAVCEATANDKERGWLAKVRPYWGHYYHFHIRIACPKGSANCESQPPVGTDDGCGAELTRWLALVKHPPRPGPPGPERRPIMLDQLPADCRTVLAGGAPAAAAPKAAGKQAESAAKSTDKSTPKAAAKQAKSAPKAPSKSATVK
jgi:penicillin-insensitive murein endopeptidase